MTKGYEEFKTMCELASQLFNIMGLHHTIDCRDYENYNWFCCHFEVDKFGGIACTIKYCNEQWIYKEGSEQKIMKSLADCWTLVPHAIKEESKKRNLQEICDLINAEND